MWNLHWDCCFIVIKSQLIFSSLSKKSLSDTMFCTFFHEISRDVLKIRRHSPAIWTFSGGSSIFNRSKIESLLISIKPNFAIFNLSNELIIVTSIVSFSLAMNFPLPTTSLCFWCASSAFFWTSQISITLFEFQISIQKPKYM